MLFKLLILVSFVLVWLIVVTTKRHIIKSYLDDLKKCEYDCNAFALNPLLPVGSVNDMCVAITETRKSFEEGTLSLSALLARLPAMQQFCAEVEHIASPLLLSHLNEGRFVRSCNLLIADSLPRAIKKAKESFPEGGSALAHAIERAEQTARDAGAADRNQILFTYRRCAIAKAEMDNFAAFI